MEDAGDVLVRCGLAKSKAMEEVPRATVVSKTVFDVLAFLTTCFPTDLKNTGNKDIDV